MQDQTFENEGIAAVLDAERSDLDAAGVERIYVCGPMTGYLDSNRYEFERVARILVECGYEVTTPVELNQEHGFDFDAYPDGVLPDDLYRKFLLDDLRALVEVDVQAFVVLEGWEESRGAALEVHIARHLGIPIYDEDGARVKEPTKYRPPTDENVAESAMRLVVGSRQEQYGHPIEDFARTAGIINSLYGTEFGPQDIPVLMIAVKLSRIIQSPSKRDSWVDLVGYVLTAEMVAEKQGRELE